MSACKPPSQGRREKFRAPGQNFRLGRLVSSAPKSRDEQKEKSERSQMFEFRPKVK